MGKIKNWSKFQHFKDRKPPWVKLHRDLLDDMEWHLLEPKASKVLIGLWIIAAEYDGNLPDNKTLAFRLRLSENEIKEAVSKLGHWLIHDDISMISKGYQDDTIEPETEIEKGVNLKTLTTPKATRLSSDWELPDDWAIWCKKNRKDLNPTQVAEQFKDYWLSVPKSKGLKSDWFATWRNWCRNQKESAQKITFAERDEINRRRRWEEMTGQKWPDNHQLIDSAPTFLGIEQ